LSQQYPNPNGPSVPPQQPYPGVPQAAVNPGQTLGVVGLILAFVIAPVGLILSIVGLSKSKKAGMGNGVAVAGIVISAIFIVIATVTTIVMVGALSTLASQCAELGPGVHYVNGVTITCS